MSYQILFWTITVFTSLLRLLIIGRIGLTGDEAHYWTYTRHPELSYFDHPPFVAWLIKFFTSIFGDTEFAVRLPAVLIFVAVCFLIYQLTKDLYGEKTAFWTTVILNITPVFSFLGAVLTIPDTPLSLFWVSYIYLFYKTIKDNKPVLWYAQGLVLGLALLSKYNAALLPVSALLYLIFSKEDRHHLLRKEPYIALLIAFAVFLPVVIWNMENNFASFGFQMHHGFGKAAPHLSPDTFFKCFGAQAGYVSPLFFIAFWVLLVTSAIKAFRQKDNSSLLIFCFSFPTLFIFNAIASFNEILPHWPAMGYLILAPAAGDLAVRMWHKNWFKVFAVAACAFALFLCAIIPLQAIFKIIPPEILLSKTDAVKIEDGITHAEKIDATNELYGWKEVGTKIAEILQQHGAPAPFVFTHRHYIASQLSFYIPGKPRIYNLSERLDAYDFWQRDLCELDGKDGVFVTNDYFYIDPSKVFPFESWEKPETVEIYRNGKKVRIFWITVGRKFKLTSLPPEYSALCAGPKLTFMQGLRKIDYKVFWLFNRDIDLKVVNFAMWKFTKFDTDYGFNSGLAVLVIGVAIILWFTKREKFLGEFVLFLGIIGVGGILVHVLKDLFGRMRPLVIFGQQVRVFHELLERGSFPSGHSQIAFSVATYLTSRFKKYWWVFYTGALCMGLSRIYIGVHFPLDVLGGAIVGTAVALVMIKLVKID